MFPANMASFSSSGTVTFPCSHRIWQTCLPSITSLRSMYLKNLFWNSVFRSIMEMIYSTVLAYISAESEYLSSSSSLLTSIQFWEMQCLRYSPRLMTSSVSQAIWVASSESTASAMITPFRLRSVTILVS